LGKLDLVDRQDTGSLHVDGDRVAEIINAVKGPALIVVRSSRSFDQ
jgi:hypothetical protein